MKLALDFGHKLNDMRRLNHILLLYLNTTYRKFGMNNFRKVDIGMSAHLYEILIR